MYFIWVLGVDFNFNYSYPQLVINLDCCWWLNITEYPHYPRMQLTHCDLYPCWFHLFSPSLTYRNHIHECDPKPWIGTSRVPFIWWGQWYFINSPLQSSRSPNWIHTQYMPLAWPLYFRCRSTPITSPPRSRSYCVRVWLEPNPYLTYPPTS